MIDIELAEKNVQQARAKIVELKNQLEAMPKTLKTDGEKYEHLRLTKLIEFMEEVLEYHVTILEQVWESYEDDDHE